MRWVGHLIGMKCISVSILFLSSMLILSAHAERPKNITSCLKVLKGEKFQLLANPAAISHSLMSGIGDWMEMQADYKSAYPMATARRHDFRSMPGTESFDQLPDSAKADYVARFTFQQWELWNSVTDNTRQAYLGVELDRLTIPNPDSVFMVPAQRARLEVMSRGNHDRMLAFVYDLFPLTSETLADDDLIAEVKDFADRQQFHFLRALNIRRDTGYFPPIVSPRELQKYGSIAPTSFYSQLVGTSNAVELTTVALDAGADPLSVNAGFTGLYARINDGLVQSQGFMLPGFRDVPELLQFFRIWQPEAFEELFRANRQNIPSQIRTLEDFTKYLIDDENARRTFGWGSAAERLAPLRRRLGDFVLTTTDAKSFLWEAFNHYLLYQASYSPHIYKKLYATMNEPGGMNTVFAKAFLPFMGWSRASLFIPAVIPARNFTVLRFDAPPTLPATTPRVDHTTKP